MRSLLYFMAVFLLCVWWIFILYNPEDFLSEQESEPIVVTHIVSAFRHERSINRTFESMIEAGKYANFSVQFISVHFQEDDHVVPFQFEKYFITRSTLDLFPMWERKLPFVQDILDVGLKHSLGDIIVFTNNDIVLNAHFYQWVEKKMHDFDSLTVNKRLLINVPDDLPIETYYQIPGINHGGFDCFVWNRKLNQKINMGNLFLGHRPWGKTLRALLSRISNTTQEFYSWSNLTFHFGNERSWEWNTRQNAIFNGANEGYASELWNNLNR